MRGTLALLLASATLWAATPAAPPKEISLPGGEGGIGFDDLRYSSALRCFLVPAGRTGMLHLVDPATLQLQTANVGATRPASAGGHGDGVTSADDGKGFVYLVDRTTRELLALDASTRRVFSRTRLGASPNPLRNRRWISIMPLASHVFGVPGGMSPVGGRGVAGMSGPRVRRSMAAS